MAERPSARRAASNRTGRVRAVLALGTVLGLGALGTMAAWTDQSTATSGSFSTGTIDMKLGSSTPVDTDPAEFTTTFQMSNMAPGDSQDGTLLVSNAGSLRFSYALQTTATNDGTADDQLGAAMQLRIYAGQTCSGTEINAPLKLSGAAFASGSRLLDAGASEWLCFRATLPANASTSLQDKRTVGTVTLTATTV